MQGPEAGAPGRVLGIVVWRVNQGIRATSLSPSKNFRSEVGWWPSSQRVSHCDLHLKRPTLDLMWRMEQGALVRWRWVVIAQTRQVMVGT